MNGTVAPSIGTPGEWAQFGLAALVIFALFTFGGMIVSFVLWFLKSMETSRQKRDEDAQKFLESCMVNHRTERAELVSTIEVITGRFAGELQAERNHREGEARLNREQFKCPMVHQIQK